MGIFTRKLRADQLQERIAAFDHKTVELETLREGLRQQQIDGMALEAAEEQAPGLPRIRKQLIQVIADLECRDLVLDRLKAELAAAEKHEALAQFETECGQVGKWLKDRAEAGKKLAVAIRALSEILAEVQKDYIPPGAVFRGIISGCGGVSTEREMLDDASRFEPPLFSLTEGIKLVGGVEGGDWQGRKHILVNKERLEEAANRAEQTGGRLRELAETSMSRHEAKIKNE